jgi:hypothetical protein
MKKKIYIVFLLASIYFPAKAQYVMQNVIGSAGDNFASSAGTVSWTIGEIVSDTWQSGQGIVTKGFHQPLGLPEVNITELENDSDVMVYPNPFSDILTIDLIGIKEGYYYFEVFDASGKSLHQSQQFYKNNILKNKIDLSYLADGLYIVKILSVENNVCHHFRLTKQ